MISAPNRNSPPETTIACHSIYADISTLKSDVQGVDPAALLVLPRLLRRVIKQDRQLRGFALRVPHRKSYVIGREALLRIAEPDELGCPAGFAFPQRVILLERPAQAELTSATADTIKLRVWRLLFHARIHLALERRIAEGRLNPAEVRRRIHQIGTIPFDEIRSVLEQESLVLPPGDDQTIYVEFAAVYLELRYFAPSLIARYFPGIEDSEAIDHLLTDDVDAQAEFQATRLPGAPDPMDVTATDRLEDDSILPLAIEESGPATEPKSDAVDPRDVAVTMVETAMGQRTTGWGVAWIVALWERLWHGSIAQRRQRYLRRAEAAAAKGNLVRSLILRLRAQQTVPMEEAAQGAEAILADLDRLIERLLSALEADRAQACSWRRPLLALAAQAAGGIWNVEARLLYDLQKVCIDHEREIYTVDLVEWALSWGRRRIQRPLPSQREVLMSKHLHQAAQRLPVVRLVSRLRHQLSDLLHAASEQAERQLRARFRPVLADTLEQVGLIPENLPERVAKAKLVETLLDRVVDQGFLTLGDLRDALSQNQLKQPDFTEIIDLYRGDPLLRADRRLAESLDGVYYRGAFYLRWMQQLSAFAFGTGAGRFFTRFVAVPFGGAYLLLGFLEHLVEKFAKGIEVNSLQSVLGLGTFFLALLYWDGFRHLVWRSFRLLWQLSRAVTYDAVCWLIALPPVQRFLNSRVTAAVFRYLVTPALVTYVVGLVLPYDTHHHLTAIRQMLTVFLGVNLLLNSRPGRNVEEIVVDGVVEMWHRYGQRILTGIFTWLVDFFRQMLEYLERILYSVDEWLRFKSGESATSLAFKAVLSLVWFLVTYVIRFCVTLLIEPQINPLKHFPVVTVSHKLLLPLIKPFGDVLVTLGTEKVMAYTVAGIIIASIPGIFGFLVWELRENWRLYRANRPQDLHPVLIGSHGETMGRLLRPGFHSGTVPKRFAKLRRAERAGREKGKWNAARKHLHALRHVERDVRRYVEREWIALLAQTGLWIGQLPSVQSIRLASNVIKIVLHRPGSDATWSILFQTQAGWLLADTSPRDSWDGLSPEQHHAILTATTGAYKTGGADLLCRQVDAMISPPEAAYEFVPGGLAVWPDPAFERQWLYRFGDSDFLEPELVRGEPEPSLPMLSCVDLFFNRQPLTWTQWVATWQELTAQKRPPAMQAATQGQ